jgi:cytochrome c oxidase subunit 3
MSSVPYTVERRPDTGVNNVMLGIWLFLASEAMLFGGLFSAYFTLRAGAVEPWRPMAGHFDAAIISTGLLFGSTASFAIAARAARARRIPAFRGWMLAATILGFLFLPYKALQYFDLLEVTLRPSSSTHWATYYLLTSVHALHVFGGLLVNGRLLLTSTASWVGGAPATVNRVEAAALYWYFVDLVWVVILVLFYVV